MKRCLARVVQLFTGNRKHMEISIEELKNRLPEVLLVDVREPDEWEFCRIEGAMHLPLGELAERCGELSAGRPVVFYCHHGMRSLAAAKRARAQGLDGALSLAGGIDAWSRLVDPSVPRY